MKLILKLLGPTVVIPTAFIGFGIYLVWQDNLLGQVLLALAGGFIASGIGNWLEVKKLRKHLEAVERNHLEAMERIKATHMLVPPEDPADYITWSIKHNKPTCPDCREGYLSAGPEGGASINFACVDCHSRFNLTLYGLDNTVIFYEKTGKITEKDLGLFERGWLVSPPH